MKIWLVADRQKLFHTSPANHVESVFWDLTSSLFQPIKAVHNYTKWPITSPPLADKTTCMKSQKHRDPHRKLLHLAGKRLHLIGVIFLKTAIALHRLVTIWRPILKFLLPKDFDCKSNYQWSSVQEYKFFKWKINSPFDDHKLSRISPGHARIYALLLPMNGRCRTPQLLTNPSESFVFV